MSIQREMTLQEWVYKLPPIHSARKELDSMKAATVQQAERIATIEALLDTLDTTDKRRVERIADQAALIEKCEEALRDYSDQEKRDQWCGPATELLAAIAAQKGGV